MSGAGPRRRRDRGAGRGREGRAPARGSGAARGRQRRMRTVDFTRPDEVHHGPGAPHQARAGHVLPHRVDAPDAPSCACRSSSRSSTVASSPGRNAHAQVPAALRLRRSSRAPSRGTRMLHERRDEPRPGARSTCCSAAPGDRASRRRGPAAHRHRLGARQALPRAPDRAALDRLVRRDRRRARRSRGLDMHLETAQTAPVSEPTLALTMEARHGRATRRRSRCCCPTARSRRSPHRFNSRDDARRPARATRADAVREAVGRVEMTVRAEVAAVDLPIEQVLALRPATSSRLDARADDGVTLFAGAVPVHKAHARPQRRPPRRADHRSRWEARNDHRRGPGQARPVDRGGRLRHAGDVRARADQPGDVAVVARRPAPARGHPRPAWRRWSPTSTASPAATCS